MPQASNTSWVSLLLVSFLIFLSLFLCTHYHTLIFLTGVNNFKISIMKFSFLV